MEAESPTWAGTHRGLMAGTLSAMSTLLIVLAMSMSAPGLSVSVASAAIPDPLWKVCGSGSGAGRCSIPRGIGVNSETGRVFVADQGNRRINEFTAWGEFVKSWGWDVVESGPGDDVVPPENQFEICVAAAGDICKTGANGAGAGQFGVGVQGVAIDSVGAVYVVDFDNHRVQKFDAAGHFVLMFGGGVNKTKGEEGAGEPERNVCPVDPADICQGGALGAGDGQFEEWAVGSFIALDQQQTSTAGDDIVYVGDSERIQLFDSGGHYLGDLPDPDGVLTGSVQSLALDPVSDHLYLAQEGRENVWKLDLAGNEACQLSIERPSAIAADVSGRVWVVNDEKFGTPLIEMRLVQFDSASCAETASFNAAEDGFKRSTGLATNICAGNEAPGNLYLSNTSSTDAFVRAYGTAPVGCELPPERPPEIGEQYAVSVGPDSALVRARISPHFMLETEFHVEYGTGECAAGGCPLRAPVEIELSLGEERTQDFLRTKGIFLSGLSPGTTYHYRFVAEGEGGGPEFGLRPKGKEGEDGEATFAAGLEATFDTPAALSPNADCANQTLRTGPSAFLPDCRAFEMVSPVDKNGGGIEALRTLGSAAPRAAHDRSSSSGQGVTYSAKQVFGDALGGPYSSQYISSRGTPGWTTHSVNAPHKGFPGGLESTSFDVEYKHFSEDLAQAWLVHEANPPLAPCGPVNSSALYRRDNETDSYEALHCEPGELLRPREFELLGVSTDGCKAVFRSPAELTGEAAGGEGIIQLYESSCEAPPNPQGPVRLASILPNGERCREDSTAGTVSDDNDDGRAKPVWHAFSEDGKRLYWSCGESLYLRENPDQPQSQLALGGAGGTGKLVKNSANVTNLVAAKAIGDLIVGSDEVTALKTTVGRFLVGQPVNPMAGKIPAGTTIAEVGEGTLKLSAAALSSATGVNITSGGPQPFAVGQTIVGRGIPTGTTILAAGAGTLALSNNASEAVNTARLESFSECTEAQKACSHPVAEPACNLEGCKGPRFQSASPDGARLLFTGFDPGTNDYLLRSFDAPGKVATTLAVGLVGQVGGRHLDLMGASEDGRRAYLVSTKVLTEVPNSADEKAAPGGANLYLRREDGSFSFIGTLSAGDLRNDEITPSPVHPERFLRASRISPDGLHAAFISSAPLTGFDNTDAESGEADVEVFVYDATANGGAGKIVCASCNASGWRPSGAKISVAEIPAAAWIPGWTTQLYQGRPLSEDGRRLFFNSFEALVDRDTNNRQDVYQWEQVDATGKAGREECEEKGAELFNEEASGCISLISSGQSPTDSEFIDADEDGSDVFIRTGESLLPQDPGLVDVYDVRVGGGFPPPAAPKPPCEGEGCQSPPPAPQLKTPASLAVGPPNVKRQKPRPCPKGKRKVRKGGKTRCVPRKGKQSKRRARNRQGRAAR